MIPQPLSGLARLAANSTWGEVDWARRKLEAHAGKSVCFEAWPGGFAAITLRISAEGDWQDAQPDAVPDATMRITPALFARLLNAPGKLGSAFSPDASGDPALVETLRDLHDVLPLAIEEKMSSVVGPVIAHGLWSAVASIGTWPAYAAERAGAGLAAYWTQENATLPGRPAFATFRQEIADLGRRVDALDARLQTPELQTPFP